MRRHCLLLGVGLVGAGLAVSPPAAPAVAAGPGTIYWVDGANPNAADTNSGTAAAPWQTLGRAGKAAELKPGDTVLVQTGVYRETMDITVSGAPGRPITFAAAPAARVVIKGSELLQGPWTKLVDDKTAKEPFPNAFQRLWKIRLGEEFFTDPRYPGAYADKSRRHLSQVFISDRQPLQLVGPSPMYDNSGYTVLEPLGKGLADMRDGTFFFDRDEQTLYVKLGGEPGWSWVEVSVRAFTLTVSKAHDVVVRGFEARHNRQVGGQWPLAAVSECERVTVEDCKFEFADFCGLGVHSSRDCVVRRCDLSWNGDSGLGLGLTRDCLVEDCTLMFNNYRRFSAGWHAGGMKNIPSNKRTTIRRCEVAYNVDSCGIWFDIDNRDIRILDNVCHHNGLTGIFHEGNGGGGVIAGNLCYGNRGDGIMISDHVPVAGLREVAKRDAQDDADTPDKPLWVVNNTLAANVQGLRTEDRGGWQILRDVRLLNNLFLSNTEPGDVNQGAAAELLFWMHAGPDDKRADTSNHSDYNVFNAATPLILKPGYGFNNTRTFEQWQQRFGEDLHSRLVPVTFTSSHAGFRLVTTTGLDVAAPLPEAVTAVWKPDHPQRVGANLTQWPATGDR